MSNSARTYGWWEQGLKIHHPSRLYSCSLTQSRVDSKILRRRRRRRNHRKLFPTFRCRKLPNVLCTTRYFLPVSLNDNQSSISLTPIVKFATPFNRHKSVQKTYRKTTLKLLEIIADVSATDDPEAWSFLHPVGWGVNNTPNFCTTPPPASSPINHPNSSRGLLNVAFTVHS